MHGDAPVDRVAAVNQALARAGARDTGSGYLKAILDALRVPEESQLLVFSKTGAQRAFTSPRTPRALYFNASAAVGYVPGAPSIEIALDDPRQGVEFYTVEQSAAAPVLARQTSCQSCHVSAGTLDVPGLIARSHTVGLTGQVLPRSDTHDVDHRTGHPDRWGGWYVTTEAFSDQYAQRAHSGNITFSDGGSTSNQIFVDWMSSAPESRGYLSGRSDVVVLQVFDHQVHAINLIAKLQAELRRGAAANVTGLAGELAEYLLFVDEAPLQVPLTARPAFAAYLQTLAPHDARGRSVTELDLERRLLKYPCSYMIYSEAFAALPATVKGTVYARMREILSDPDVRGRHASRTAADRLAVREILDETVTGFRD